MTQPPALRHAHTLTRICSKPGRSSRCVCVWRGVSSTFSCTAAANTRSAYRKQAGEDKSRSDGAAGHAIAARVCGRLSPTLRCVFVLLNMKRLHSRTGASVWPSEPKHKPFLTFLIVSNLIVHGSHVATLPLQPRNSPTLTWTFYFLFFQRCRDPEMRAKLMEIPLG